MLYLCTLHGKGFFTDEGIGTLNLEGIFILSIFTMTILIIKTKKTGNSIPGVQRYQQGI